MNRRGEAGVALADALVSLALTVTVLAAALPAVLAADRLAGAASRRAVLADGGRLVARRLQDDLRRAGFGLAGRLPGVVVEAGGGGVTMQYLEGGFQGGTPLTALAAAAATRVQVQAAGGYGQGDTIVLTDRQGGFASARVVAVDAAADWLEINPALTRAFSPAAGGRIYRLAERRWWLDGRLLRRDDQPAVDAVASMGFAAWGAPAAVDALAWMLDGTGAGGGTPAAMISFRLVLAGAGDRAGPRSALPELPLSLLQHAVNSAPPMAAASPLP